MFAGSHLSQLVKSVLSSLFSGEFVLYSYVYACYICHHISLPRFGVFLRKINKPQKLLVCWSLGMDV